MMFGWILAVIFLGEPARFRKRFIIATLSSALGSLPVAGGLNGLTMSPARRVLIRTGDEVVAQEFSTPLQMEESTVTS
jgi:hypothetical protein